jgi:4-hydroxy-tetrahydrodipicolinate synthase
MAIHYKGVLPAITTPFAGDGAVDTEVLAALCQRLIGAGCIGIVATGSLGESATLTFDEKVAIYEACVSAVPEVPVIAGIAALSTAEAVALAEAARSAGCQGLMVLPPYVYSTDWREMKAHVGTVIGATQLSCLLYNNPVAYKTDFLPEHVLELAREFPNLEAIKESSGDVRRVTQLRHTLGTRLTLLVGLDDCIAEGIRAGAEGWIAGLVNAFPEESVALYDAAIARDDARADALYEWFLPLLRLDTVPKFVQHIKWVQSQVGNFPAAVRAPRRPLAGADLERTMAVLESARATRTKIEPLL